MFHLLKTIMGEDCYLPLDALHIEAIQRFELEQSQDGSVEFFWTLGMVLQDGYHSYRGFNKFLAQPAPIPSFPWKTWQERVADEYEAEYGIKDVQQDQINSVDFPSFEQYEKMHHHTGTIDYYKLHVCDPTASFFHVPIPHPLNFHKNALFYDTIDDGSIGFVVVMEKDDDTVSVYGRTKCVILQDDDSSESDENENDLNSHRQIFTELIATFHPMKIFVGTSVENEMTTRSGDFGKEWDGNSILLQIRSEAAVGSQEQRYEYVHIGTNMFSFETSEPIVEYISNVSDNAVAFPYAASNSFVYEMSTHMKKSIEFFPTRFSDGDCFDTPNGCASSPLDNWQLISGRNTDEERWEESVHDDYLLPRVQPDCFRLSHNWSLPYCEIDSCYGRMKAGTCSECGRATDGEE
jgi:hypothetical protein